MAATGSLDTHLAASTTARALHPALAGALLGTMAGTIAGLVLYGDRIALPLLVVAAATAAGALLGSLLQLVLHVRGDGAPATPAEPSPEERERLERRLQAHREMALLEGDARRP